MELIHLIEKLVSHRQFRHQWHLADPVMAQQPTAIGLVTESLAKPINRIHHQQIAPFGKELGLALGDQGCVLALSLIHI